MKLIFQRILIALCILGLSGLPGQTRSTQSKPTATQKKKKPAPSKKRPAKKQSTKKKPTKKKPTKKQTVRKKRRPPTKKAATKSSASKKPQRKKRTAKPRKKPVPKKTSKAPQKNQTPKAPAVNPMALSTEFRSMTEELESSRRKLAMAVSYLEPTKRKKIVTIESRSLNQSSYRSPENLKDATRNAEANQDWAKLRDLAMTRIQQDPLNPDFHYQLGRAYARMGELNKARQAFEEVLDIDPSHQQTLNALASLSRNSDTRIMSAEVLDYSTQRTTQGPAAEMAAIRQAIDNGEFEKARSLAVKGLESHPRHGGFKFLEGLALEKQGLPEEAKIAYQQAVKLDRNNLEAHRALANLYFELGKYVYAGLSYSDLAELDPTNEEAWYLQGLSYYKANEWGKAVEAWEELRRLNPRHALLQIMLPQMYYVLAVEYNRKGEAALGRTAFDKAMALNPNTYSWLPKAMRTLGQYYREKKMYKESLAAYQEVVELRPKDANAYLGMGITYWKMNEPQLARAAWDRSLELNPDNNEARGWLMITRQDS